MTALRRSAPLLAPRVSSNAVGSTSPMPTRPRVARNRYGSSFQAIFLERNSPSRLLENAANARLKRLGRRFGSTYLSVLLNRGPSPCVVSRFAQVAVEGSVHDPALHAGQLVRPAGPLTVVIGQLFGCEGRPEAAAQLVQDEADAAVDLARIGLARPACAVFPLEDR